MYLITFKKNEAKIDRTKKKKTQIELKISVNKTSRQMKFSKYIGDLNNTISQLNLMDM